MPSKLVTTREKSTRSLSSAMVTHGGAVANALEDELRGYLEKGEKFPNVTILIKLLDRKLRADLDKLVQADTAHELELSDDAGPRNHRDAAAEKVRTTLVDLRDAITTAYGAAGLRVLGLDQAIPVDPAAVAARARAVLENLLSEKIKLPAPRRASLHVDRQGFANELGADLPALVKALEDVSREEREAKATLANKNAAMGTHDASFSRSANLLSALAAMGALDELAGSFRPSTRKAARTVGDEEEPVVEGGGGAEGSG